MKKIIPFFVSFAILTTCLYAQSNTAPGYTVVCENDNIQIYATMSHTQQALPSIDPQIQMIYYAYNKTANKQSVYIMLYDIQNASVSITEELPLRHGETSADGKIARIWMKLPPNDDQMRLVAMVTQGNTSIDWQNPKISCQTQLLSETDDGSDYASESWQEGSAQGT